MLDDIITWHLIFLKIHSHAVSCQRRAVWRLNMHFSCSSSFFFFHKNLSLRAPDRAKESLENCLTWQSPLCIMETKAMENMKIQRPATPCLLSFVRLISGDLSFVLFSSQAKQGSPHLQSLTMTWLDMTVLTLPWSLLGEETFQQQDPNRRVHASTQGNRRVRGHSLLALTCLHLIQTFHGRLSL